MFDGDVGFVGIFFGFIIVFSIVALIIYCIILMAAALSGIAALGGTFFGGGEAIKNYFLSFKENVIDSNRRVLATA